MTAKWDQIAFGDINVRQMFLKRDYKHNVCAGHLNLADLHVHGRCWSFQGIEFVFFLSYPDGQGLKITAKMIPLDFHHFHGFNTKINQIKLKSNISIKNSKTFLFLYITRWKVLGDISDSSKAETIICTWSELPVWPQPPWLFLERALEETVHMLHCE